MRGGGSQVGLISRYRDIKFVNEKQMYIIVMTAYPG